MVSFFLRRHSPALIIREDVCSFAVEKGESYTYKRTIDGYVSKLPLVYLKDKERVPLLGFGCFFQKKTE